MASPFTGLSGLLVRCTAAIAAMVGLASCGGGVSAPATPVAPGPIVISPSEATLFSETPTQFLVTGGNGDYLITSNLQSVVPSIGAFSGQAFTVVPNPVAGDTPVTLTVRDTASSTPATASLVVKPRTISNVVSIVPSSTACGTAICAGGDAEVRAVLQQAGLPLVGRQVRLEVVSGDARIITSPAGAPEQVSTSSTTTTDANGAARFRIRVLNNATSQTALFRLTDLSSGFVLTTSANINPGTNAVLNAQPNEIIFTGPDQASCNNGASADVIVFGGRPPYQISRPAAFDVSRTTVQNSGEGFTVRALGFCAVQAPIAVVDSSGSSVTVLVTNQPASGPTVEISVSPSTINLSSCTEIASVAVVGGTGVYTFASSTSALVVQEASQGRFTIRRQNVNQTEPIATPQNVIFTSGGKSATVTVNLTTTSARAPTCPTPL